MAFTPNKLITDGINGGTDKRFQDGDILTPGAVNKIIEGILYNGRETRLLEQFTVTNATADNMAQLDLNGYSNDYEVWIYSDSALFLRTALGILGSFAPLSTIVMKVRYIANMYYIEIKGKSSDRKTIYEATFYRGFDELIYVYDQDGSGTTEISIIGE